MIIYKTFKGNIFMLIVGTILLITGIMWSKETMYILLIVGIYIILQSGVGFIWLSNHNDIEMHCRKCGKKGDMVIEYETDGVCYDCLNEILKAQGLLDEENSPQKKNAT